MLFLLFSNVNVEFMEKLGKLTWWFYTAIKALPTTSWVELIHKREFAKAATNENLKTFVVYVVVLQAKALIHSF